MNRKDFIKNCGFACAGALVSVSILQSCISIKMVKGTLKNDAIIINLSDFKIINKKGVSYRNYVIVKNEHLKFPISVYRIQENKYSALWMKCTHQGNELTVYGDKLHCSAHGSEFDKNGAVTNGPASTHLKTFPVIKENELLKILLHVV